MEDKKQDNIHFTFHNPNTPQKTAEYLIKLLAQEMAANMVQTSIPCENAVNEP